MPDVEARSVAATSASVAAMHELRGRRRFTAAMVEAAAAATDN
jgi:hypothetical protein